MSFSFDSFLASSYTSWVVAFALGAIALSGRLSLSAAKWFTLAAGILAVVGCWRSEFVLSLPALPRILTVILIASISGLAVYYLNQWMDGKPISKSSTIEKRESTQKPKPDFKLSLASPTIWDRIKIDANVFQRTESEGPDALLPLSVVFENIPEGSGFDETETVWAQIVYQFESFEGHELVRVNQGCWIGEPVADIPFPLRKPRYLLLGGWYNTMPMPTMNEFRTFEYSRDLHKPVLKKLKMAGPETLAITVILTPSGHSERAQEYKFFVKLLDCESGFCGFLTSIK